MYRKYEAQGILMRRLSIVAAMALGLAACGSSGSVTNSPVQVPVQAENIDVLSAVVTPSYTLDGGVFPASEYNDGNFLLRSTTEKDDIVPLGSSHDASPAAVRVVQDSYDVLYQHETGSAVPQNVNTPVQATGLINADLPLAVAVTSWTVTPVFSHNAGANPFPASEYDDGQFFLQPTGGGERLLIGNSHTVSPGAVRVMAGSYDVIYALETGGNLVPGNKNTRLASGVSVAKNESPFNVDVRSVRFQFDATLDTSPFPASQDQQAHFILRNTTTADQVDLGSSVELPVSVFVAEGTYDIVYQHVQGNQLPVNTDAVIAKGVLIGSSGASSINVDIASVAITPAFSLDGNAFPASEYNDANFYLRSLNNANDVMFIGASEVAPTAVRVISSAMDIDAGAPVLALGDYQVLYRHASGQVVPQNSNAVVLNNQTLATDGAALNVAVNSLEVSGKFTLNGKSFPNDASNSVQFFLRGDDQADAFLFGYSDLSNEPVRVVSIPGSYETYDVFMDHLAGDGVPQNEMHEMAFNKLLDTDGATLSVDIPAVRVKPTFTLDGQAFPASIYQSATFYLHDLHGGSLIFLGYSYKDNDPVMVIKEDHEVIYGHLNGEQTPQNSQSNLKILDL